MISTALSLYRVFDRISIPTHCKVFQSEKLYIFFSFDVFKFMFKPKIIPEIYEIFKEYSLENLELSGNLWNSQ